MKKRKALYLIPVAALILSGCTLQEGWDTVSGFFVNDVYNPVKDWVENLLGIKHEDKKEEQQGGGQQGGGEQQGEGEQKEVSKYGDAEHPLSVSAANALIAEANPTEEEVYVVGEVLTNEVWNSEYGQTTITLTDGEQTIKVFRVAEFPEGFDKEGIKANSMKGQTVVAKGIGEIYNNTYELTSPAVLSVTGEGPVHHDVDNYGTAQEPLTVSQAIEVIKLQDPTEQPIFVTGKVKSHGAWSTKYNNVDIVLTDGTNDLTMFRAEKFFEGFDPTTIKDNAYVGQIAVAKGTGMYYVDGQKYELAQGCELLSMEEEVIPVTGVELSQQALALEVGDQAALTASVLPDNAKQEVTWTVESDPATVEVAKYEDGKVVALAAGTAVVTATSVADQTKSASCTVTVTEATKTLLSIAFAGAAEKTAYNEDEAYSAAGLKVMAHYDKGEDVDVTENATISLDKEVAEEGDTKFTVTAKYGSVADATIDVAVTVTAVNQFVEAYNAALALSSGATQEYIFKGVIAAKRQDNEWFIQHEGYGIEYYGTNENFAVGKQVKVKATLQNYKGLPETKTIAYGKVIGDGTMPTPIELASSADVEAAKLNVLANITGTAKEDWSSYSASANTTLKLVGSDNKDMDVYFKKDLFSAKENTLKAVKAGDTVTFTNVETSIYTTRQILFVAGSDVQVTAAPVKTIASVTSVTGPATIAQNGTISTSEVTVVVEYTDGSSGNATVTAVTCDTSTAGSATADVTIEGWNETLHFTVTVQAPSGTEVTKTYTFGEHSDYANWSTSYEAHTLSYDECDVVFEKANKQSAGQTIDNMPVTKGFAVELKAKNNKSIVSITFVCKQWGSKAQTITLHYSTNGGTDYTSTGITSTNFTISSSSLAAGTNAVKITFSSTSNQVGIESATATFK